MFVYLLLLLSLLPLSNGLQVQLSTGTIEGKALTSTISPLGNHTARVFLGIPYATPPLGNLRFRKPRGMGKWQGVMETKEYKPACMSDVIRTYKNDVGGLVSEDCLYLNVFTNDYCLQKRNCAVMIAVHGGGFMYESASAFNPEIFINNFVGQGRNIVVVTVDYRLGVFGFGQLNGDFGTSGDRNIALHDLLFAIKWVKREIGAFGGDPNRITLHGHSAGAALSMQVTSSPLSRGLLHQQILMSAPLSTVSKRNNFKAMTAVAMHLGCLKEEYGFEKLPKEVIEDTYKCMRDVSAEKLLDAQFYVLRNTTYFLGAPYVDGEFVVDYPDRLFDKKSITPLTTMIGTTNAELRQIKFITTPEYSFQKEDLHRNICETIGYEMFSDPKKFSQNCYDYYKKGDDVQHLGDDYEFYSGAINVANAHLSNQTKVFLYSYEYTGAGGAYAEYQPGAPSPHHSEDLIYVFGTHRAVMAPKDYIIEHIYSGLYANFINFGDPSGEQKWVPYSEKNREYFLIDFDKNFTMPGMREQCNKRAYDFWINSGYQMHHKETWAPSLDTNIIANLINPMKAFFTGNTIAIEDKNLENDVKLYKEREEFLITLKEQKNSSLQPRNGEFYLEGVKGEGGINILLIIFAGTMLIGIFYLSMTHFCLHSRSREGYQLLK